MGEKKDMVCSILNSKNKNKTKNPISFHQKMDFNVLITIILLMNYDDEKISEITLFNNNNNKKTTTNVIK